MFMHTLDTFEDHHSAKKEMLASNCSMTKFSPHTLQASWANSIKNIRQSKPQTPLMKAFEFFEALHTYCENSIHKFASELNNRHCRYKFTCIVLDIQQGVIIGLT